jgi:phenylacetate-CoA ligase
LFLGGQRIAGSQAWSRYREFLALEWSDAKAIRLLQEQRVEGLLRHAAVQVPYYRERVAAERRPALDAFPILTKEAVHRDYRLLMTPALAREYDAGRPRGYSWKVVRTGGTTGTPTTVIHDKRFRDFGRASRLYSQRLCGFPFGVPYLRLWGSMKDINGMRDSVAQRIMRLLARETLLNAFRMDEPRMRAYIEEIERSPARHMMAYVDCAEQLARFIRETGQRVRSIDTFMACAGTVTPEARSIIETAFRCRVHNKYGSRECSDMACECEMGGLHVYANHVLLEVVDERGATLPAEADGRILVTLLNNYQFPLIRYEIGDTGALSAGRCRCGRSFPLLKRVEGRTSEILKTGAGATVTPTYIRHLVGVVHNPGVIRRFQFVQNSPTDYDLTLETDSAPDSLLATVTANLERDLKQVLGPGSKVATRRVSRIPEAGNGKFLYVISKVGR